jgi:DNA repair and recombination RAD54-like protein
VTIAQGFEKGKPPIARRAAVICPTSLVSNWANEIKKWTGDHLKIVALSEANKEKAIDGINQYLSLTTGIQVIIISYETYRINKNKFIK